MASSHTPHKTRKIIEQGNRFQITGELGRGTMGVVYKAWDEERNIEVALKTLKQLNADEIYNLKREFRTLQGVVHPNLCRLIELVEQGGVWFFVMELIYGVDFLTYTREPKIMYDFKGQDVIPQTHWPLAKDEAPTIQHFDESRLRNGLADLASGLSFLHTSGWVHRDVKPSNVLVTREKKAVLLDYGLVLDWRDRQFDGTMTVAGAGGTPEYMAPEQIDNVIVGAPADCYSVGVMLYEALTGCLPFEGGPAKILLQKQIATPLPPSRKCESVPIDLEQLCMDLLHKDPGERPTAKEILERIKPAPENASAVKSNFTSVVATSVTVELFGRGEELGALHKAFDESRKGRVIPVVIEGDSGVGKTALLHKFIATLKQRHPDLIALSGRCYENESVPFKAFDAAMDSLARYLRALPVHVVESLLPDETSLLARIFPQLSRVLAIGTAEDKNSKFIEPREMQRRAFGVLQEILERMASDHPLVLAIDDLQWTDRDSLLLLEHILGAADSLPMLLILSSRNLAGENEVFHEWDSFVKGDLIRIPLLPLNPDSSRELAKSCLAKAGISRTSNLANSIAKEAEGHPLYIAELALFSQQFKDRELIHARLEEVIWNRIVKLPTSARRILELSCISGVPFRLDYLREFLRLDEAETLKYVAILEAGKLTRTRGTRKHVQLEPYHDRVRGAVLEQLSQQQKTIPLQLRLGKFLYHKFILSDMDEHIFEITRHLNAAAGLLHAPQEKLMLVDLNFQAGKKAREGAAYVSALDHFMKGRKFLEEDAWQRHYNKVFELHVATIEAAYLAGEYSLTKNLVDDIFKHTRTTLDRTQVVEILILSLIGQGELAQALDQAVNIIKELGVRLPRHPNKFQFVTKLLATKFSIWGKTPKELATLTQTANPNITAAKRIMTILGTTAYQEEPLLFAMTGLEGVNLCLKYGIDEMSAIGYGSFGVINSAVLGKYEAGYEFGQLALQLLNQYENNRSRPMVLFIFACFIQHFKEHVRRTLPYFQESYRVAREIGELVFLGFASTSYCLTSFLAGINLPRLIEEIDFYSSAQRDAKQFSRLTTMGIIRQTAISLRCPSDEGQSSNGDASAGAIEWEFDRFKADSDSLNIYYFLFSRLILQYFFGNYEEAFATALELEDYSSANVGTYTNTVGHFYSALALISHCEQAGSQERRTLLAKVEQHQRKMKQWSTFSPENYRHKFLLIQAEYQRIRGNTQRACELYPKAIEGAIKNQFPHEAALAAELSAKFFLKNGERVRAQKCILDAIEHHTSWGARAKVSDLLKRYSALVPDCETGPRVEECSIRECAFSVKKSGRV